MIPCGRDGLPAGHSRAALKHLRPAAAPDGQRPEGGSANGWRAALRPGISLRHRPALRSGLAAEPLWASVSASDNAGVGLVLEGLFQPKVPRPQVPQARSQVGGGTGALGDSRPRTQSELLRNSSESHLGDRT